MESRTLYLFFCIDLSLSSFSSFFFSFFLLFPYIYLDKNSEEDSSCEVSICLLVSIFSPFHLSLISSFLTCHRPLPTYLSGIYLKNDSGRRLKSHTLNLSTCPFASFYHSFSLFFSHIYLLAASLDKKEEDTYLTHRQKNG